MIVKPRYVRHLLTWNATTILVFLMNNNEKILSFFLFNAKGRFSREIFGKVYIFTLINTMGIIKFTLFLLSGNNLHNSKGFFFWISHKIVWFHFVAISILISNLPHGGQDCIEKDSYNLKTRKMAMPNTIRLIHLIAFMMNICIVCHLF